MTTDKERLAALLPCPFCGGTAAVGYATGSGWNKVFCMKCDTAVYKRGERCVEEFWNTRIPDSNHTALEQENARLRAALEFYRDEWQINAEGDFSEPGLSRSWREPTDALWDDNGRRAQEALHNPTEAK